MTILANRLSSHRTALDPRDAKLVDPSSIAVARSFVISCPGYAPTPLVPLDGLARSLGLGTILIKDESGRLGLKSFKAIGGSFAIAQLVSERAAAVLGRPVNFPDLGRKVVQRVASEFTFACATDGNHGVAVAYGAKLVGAACVIFLHSGVSDARADAIAMFGAELRRVEGNYDDAVAEAARCCAQFGWTELADTAREGHERIPALVMQGYAVLLSEAGQQLAQAPTHIFVQAGVGGLAGTLAAQSATMFGADRPIIVVVEPAKAACLLASLAAEQAVKIEAHEPTIMAMLECYEPSLIAWRILSRAADYFMTVNDEDAIAAMNCLARPIGRDIAVVAGESGSAGLAGLIRAATSPEIRANIGLDQSSRILVIATEGATDPDRYRSLVGLDPDGIRRS
jgi:diaminopropionate ammonia-lyase